MHLSCAAAIGFSSSLAICQCRGENGELGVGVRRRLCHQQNPMPSSVISSQSMHLGVLATARHAVNTNTMFVVYYKPRFDALLLVKLLIILEKLSLILS